LVFCAEKNLAALNSTRPFVCLARKMMRSDGSADSRNQREIKSNSFGSMEKDAFTLIVSRGRFDKVHRFGPTTTYRTSVTSVMLQSTQ
jgi:hypothetical protein